MCEHKKCSCDPVCLPSKPRLPPGGPASGQAGFSRDVFLFLTKRIQVPPWATRKPCSGRKWSKFVCKSSPRLPARCPSRAKPASHWVPAAWGSVAKIFSFHFPLTAQGMSCLSIPPPAQLGAVEQTLPDSTEAERGFRLKAENRGSRISRS